MTKQVKKRKENSIEKIEKKSKLENEIVTPPQSDTSSTIEKDSVVVHENLNVKEDSGSDFEDDSEFSDEEEDMVENIQAGEDSIDLDNDDELNEKLENLKVYLPGDKLENDEELVVDQSTYEMLHRMNVEWPCLSFDIIPDKLGDNRTSFPMTSYLIAGSQADHGSNDDKLYVMKMSSLQKTRHDDDSDSDNEDEDMKDTERDPVLEYKMIPVPAPVNRLRVMPHKEISLVAHMSENGNVYVHDATEQFRSFDTPGLIPARNPEPLYVGKMHKNIEGFGIDWHPNGDGRLLTGDMQGLIYLTKKTGGAGGNGFQTDIKSFRGHEGSIEDIQWSPSQSGIFASCSSDQTIRIWDLRTKSKPQLSIHAHDSDVNVISWNKTVDYLLASGSDSGSFSIWDLRNWPSTTTTLSTNSTLKTPAPAASFSWHKAPITSIQFHPTDSSVLAVSGSDDQVTLWDLALERDEEEEHVFGEKGEERVVPPQLLFIHQGQKSVKEVRWHAQCPGVLLTTAFDGFNIFKTFNME